MVHLWRRRLWTESLSLRSKPPKKGPFIHSLKVADATPWGSRVNVIIDVINKPHAKISYPPNLQEKVSTNACRLRRFTFTFLRSLWPTDRQRPTGRRLNEYTFAWIHTVTWHTHTHTYRNYIQPSRNDSLILLPCAIFYCPIDASDIGRERERERERERARESA